MTSPSEILVSARTAFRQNQLDKAAALCGSLIEQDKADADAFQLLGLIAYRQEKLDESVSALSQAVALRPKSAEFHSQLASVYLQARRYADAAAAASQALQIKPNLAEAELTLGNALYSLSQLSQAAEHFRRALAINPKLLDALNNLGLVARASGDLTEAERCFRRVIELQPDSAGVHVNLANVLRNKGDHAAAVTTLQNVIAAAPDLTLAHENLAELFDTEGRVDEARACYRQAFQLTGRAPLRLKSALAMPPIYDSLREIAACRNRLLDEIKSLSAEGIRFNPVRDELPSTFYLAYQAQDDRSILELIAALYACETEVELPPKKHVDGKIHVGFVSSFLKDHTIGQLFRGLIERLSHDRFHVTVLLLSPATDAVSAAIRASADNVVELPRDAGMARDRVLAERLDVLFYTDIGMDPTSTALAACRLAPVQCVGWGHPVTTGLATVDYLVSSELIEPDNGCEHYSERLIKLPVLPACYTRPQLANPRRSRESFGLSSEKHIYLCPQNLFKFHPDFDPLLAGILEWDPAGELVLIEGRFAYWTELLMHRFKRTIPDAIRRIRFLPSQSRADFLQLLALADVMLDPLHFGGGNTSYEALGVGTPVVTLPSSLMRGRVTHGCYRQMGVLDCVAQSSKDYVRIAVELATDQARRGEVSSKIIDAADKLFETDEAVRALEKFFEQAIAAEPKRS